MIVFASGAVASASVQGVAAMPGPAMGALECLGWLGAGAVLLAYGLLTVGRLREAGRWYLVLNLAGSVGLAVNGLVHEAWPSVVLNVLWLAIAVYGEQRLRRRSRLRMGERSGDSA